MARKHPHAVAAEVADSAESQRLATNTSRRSVQETEPLRASAATVAREAREITLALASRAPQAIPEAQALVDAVAAGVAAGVAAEPDQLRAALQQQAELARRGATAL